MADIQLQSNVIRLAQQDVLLMAWPKAVAVDGPPPPPRSPSPLLLPQQHLPPLPPPMRTIPPLPCQQRASPPLNSPTPMRQQRCATPSQMVLPLGSQSCAMTMAPMYQFASTMAMQQQLLLIQQQQQQQQQQPAMMMPMAMAMATKQDEDDGCYDDDDNYDMEEGDEEEEEEEEDEHKMAPPSPASAAAADAFVPMPRASTPKSSRQRQEEASRELRRLRYKTAQCEHWQKHKGCPFGAACCFLHGDAEQSRYACSATRDEDFHQTEQLRSKEDASPLPTMAQVLAEGCPMPLPPHHEQPAKQHKNDIFRNRCELCNVFTNTEKSILQHYQGRVHRTNLVRQRMSGADCFDFDAATDFVQREWVGLLGCKTQMGGIPSFIQWRKEQQQQMMKK